MNDIAIVVGSCAVSITIIVAAANNNRYDEHGNPWRNTYLLYAIVIELIVISLKLSAGGQ